MDRTPQPSARSVLSAGCLVPLMPRSDGTAHLLALLLPRPLPAGFGMLSAAATACICLAAFQSSIENNVDKLDTVW